VKALLATAVQRKDLRMNPVAGYRTRFEVKPQDETAVERVKALSDAELQALLSALETADAERATQAARRRESGEPAAWRPFYEFLAQTGLRIGEAIEVRWKDIDLGKQTLKVSRRFYRDSVAPPKSKYGRRTVRLSPAMATRLWTRWAATQPDPEELVWRSEDGKRIDQSNLMSRVLKPAAVAAGLGEMVADGRGGWRSESWVGHHTFRHTCATMLFRRGLNAVQVQRWLGHHKPSFTLDTYVHLLEEDLPEAAFLDEMVGNRWAPSPPEMPSRPVGVTEAEIATVEPIPAVLPRAVSAR
jgi:integrase